MKAKSKTHEQLVLEFNRAVDGALLNQTQTAAFLGCATATLERHRWAGTGIPFIKVGHLVKYRKSDVLAYISSHMRTSTSQGAI